MDPDVLIKCAENIQNSPVLTKFGYSRQYTKCIQNFQNSRVLTKFGYRRLRYYDSEFVYTGVMDIMTSMIRSVENVFTICK